MMNTTVIKSIINRFIVRVAAFSLLLMMFFSVTAFASVNKDANEAINGEDDYTFVVIEDEEVPLAAAPAENDYSPYVFWVVVISILVVGIFFHGITIFNYRSKVMEISDALSREEYRELMRCSILFNPIRQKDALMEKESEIAARRD